MLVALGVVGVSILLVAGVARLGGAMVRQERAQSCADVVALARATGGPAAASRVAAANRAVVVEHRRGVDGEVRVVVEHLGVRARAAADLD